MKKVSTFYENNLTGVNSIFGIRELTVFDSFVFVAGATTPTQKRHDDCVCLKLYPFNEISSEIRDAVVKV